MHRPSRGDGPRRHGPDIANVPDVGPSNVDASVYTDPARYELERQRVLRFSWLIAGRGDQIPEPGDHFVYEGHGETVVIVRQRDGSLGAFHNVCQHRGTRIVNSDGCGAEGFRCPWHGWAYGLDGQLRGVPDREDFSAEQLKGLRAPAVAVEQWQGWIWIFLAGPEQAPPLADWLGEIAAELEPYRMDDMFTFEKAVYDLPVNYKAIVDGFNEMYHIAELHKVGPAVAATARDTSFAILGRNSMMVVPLSPQEGDTLEETGDHQGTVTCHYVIFPNAVFNNLPEHLQLFLPVPTGPHSTRFEVWELQYKNGDEAYRKRIEATWKILKVIVEQDIDLFHNLSHTRQSMGYSTNRFSDHECKPTAYHEEMARMLDGDRPPVRVAKNPSED